MKFTVEHQIQGPLASVEAALFHPDYQSYLLRESGLLLDVRVERFEDDGQRIQRQVRYAPRPAFDHIGPKTIPASWFEFVEVSEYDRGQHTLRFENRPLTDKVQRHFRNSGEIQFEQLASNITVRRSQAELELHTLKLYLRPLRGLAESMIAREARKLLDAEARLLNQWISGRAEQPTTGPFSPVAEPG